MNEIIGCKKLCEESLDKKSIERFYGKGWTIFCDSQPGVPGFWSIGVTKSPPTFLPHNMIKNEYNVHFLADNLPAFTRWELDNHEVQYEHGYKLGQVENDKIYLNNHLVFQLYYNKDEVSDSYRVVGFDVYPHSVAHEDITVDENNDCHVDAGAAHRQEITNDASDMKVLFTYSVTWKESSIRWASRWDAYLEMGDVQIHWFSIINSIVVVLFLAGILTMIIVRTLRRDIGGFGIYPFNFLGIPIEGC